MVSVCTQAGDLRFAFCLKIWLCSSFVKLVVGVKTILIGDHQLKLTYFGRYGTSLCLLTVFYFIIHFLYSYSTQRKKENGELRLLSFVG